MSSDVKNISSAYLLRRQLFSHRHISTHFM